MRNTISGAARRMPWVIGTAAVTLALTALAGPATASAAAPPANGGCAVGAAWGSSNPAFASTTLRLVNQHRARIGARPLKTSASLTKAAVWKSSHMMHLGYFAHDDAAPASRTLGQRVSACGYRGASWAENIALGQRSPGEVVRAWIASPGHRANIENRRYTTTGIGAVTRAGSPTAVDADLRDRRLETPAGSARAGSAPAVRLEDRGGIGGPVTVLAGAVILLAIVHRARQAALRSLRPSARRSRSRGLPPSPPAAPRGWRSR